MTNETVYPFGQGGQLPSGYPIADDLNTSSAQQALSAKQGYVLRHDIIPVLTGMPNTTPLPLTEDGYFELGTLANNTGAESASTTVIRSIFIPVYPGASIAYSMDSGKVKIFEFGQDKAYISQMADYATQPGTYTTGASTAYIRICVTSGTAYAPDWDTVKLSVTPSTVFRCVLLEDETKYAAVGCEANTSPLPLVSTDFEAGNLGNDGKESASATALRSKDYIQVYPGATIVFSTASGYSLCIFEYNEQKNFLSKMTSGEQSGTRTMREGTFYIRIVIYSGQTGTWNDIALSIIPNYLYKYVRAVAPEKIEAMIQEGLNGYGTIELPILAPSLQRPADGNADSDFNAETLTSQEMQMAFEALIEKMPQIWKNAMLAPAYGSVYETVGRDASNQFDIKAYVFTRRNRLCFRASAALYAWVNGGTTYYTDHRSPLVGDTVYSDTARTDSGYAITAYDSSVPAITVNGNAYTRDESGKVSADEVFVKCPIPEIASTTVKIYDKEDTYIGTASYASGFASLTYDGKTYNRLASHDYHTDNKATIVLWGNEHGPQSDPNEPSIILYRLAKDISEGCRDNDFLSFLRGYCKVVILPVANPWGVNAWANSGQEGRNNANGVNINRNYDTPGWGAQADADKGSYAGDQPETQFIMNTVLDFNPDICVDVHCIGYASPGSEEILHWQGVVPAEISKMRQTIFDYCSIWSTVYGSGKNYENSAMGSDWIPSIGKVGGLIEMTAGPYAASYNGKQHKGAQLYTDYMFLLNIIRTWYYSFDPTFDLRRIYTK